MDRTVHQRVDAGRCGLVRQRRRSCAKRSPVTAATNEAEKNAIRQRLADAITERIDTEIEAARQRVTDLEANAAGEVDARLDRLLKLEDRLDHERPGRGGREATSRPGNSRHMVYVKESGLLLLQLLGLAKNIISGHQHLLGFHNLKTLPA